ncbi:hypothetical protein [Chenggangzhangella methanolivorans]|uniref:hypothetical protein n=1 Tax=Chenggangzhangella methanolivorans TaxID=1437009 RepID=UPI0021BDB053|nr:hypothetical protein [Chenggangzhangella methanolivorans]
MASLWPDFAATKLGDGTLIWIGPLRPKAQPYTVGIVWRPSLGLPYVTLEAPKLTPRPGVTFLGDPASPLQRRQPRALGPLSIRPEGPRMVGRRSHRRDHREMDGGMAHLL